MKTKKKVFVAGAMTFAMLGTMIPQNWNVNAASNLISNGDFEESNLLTLENLKMHPI